MAAEDQSKVDETPAPDAAEAQTDSPPTAGGKRKKLVIGAAVLLLLAGAGGGSAWYFLGGAPHEEKAEKPLEVTAEKLVDVPPMTVNLRSPDGTTRMLRVRIMLVPGEGRKEEVTGRLPLVIDRFQPFLRELRPEDISGSAATFRLKEEMLVSANAVLGAGAVRDVLIQDLVQQ